MRRLREDGARLTHLHDLPQIHHGHATADVFDQPQIVRDEQVRQLEPLLQIEEQRDDLGLNRDVQRRHGLVGDHQRRAQRNRPRNANPLPLTAAELVGITRQVRALESDQLEQFLDAGPPLEFRPEPMDDQRFLDDVADPHARVERGVRVLKDDLHVAPRRPQPRAREGEHVFVPEPDRAGGRFDQPEDAATGGALAATGLPDQTEHLSFVDRKAHIVDGLDDRRRGEEALATNEVLHEPMHVEQGRAHQRVPIPGTAESSARV